MRYKAAWFIVIVFILSTVLLSFQASAEEVAKKEITLEFSFGVRSGKYTGTLVDGLPNGKGKFESQNSDGLNWYYEGDFVNGAFQGNGTTIWDDGTKKEGLYSNGQLDGYGKQYMNSQLIYEGYWKNGEYSGEGKLYDDDQLVFKGTFKDGDIYEGKYYKDWNGHEAQNGETQTSSNFVIPFLVTMFLFFLFAFGAGFLIKASFSLFKRSINPAAKIYIPVASAQPLIKQTVQCKNCGGNNCIVLGRDAHCEYCGSALSRID